MVRLIPHSLFVFSACLLAFSCSVETARTTKIDKPKEPMRKLSEEEMNEQIKQQFVQAVDQKFTNNFSTVKGKDGYDKMESSKRSSFEGSQVDKTAGGFEKKPFDMNAGSGFDKRFEMTRWQNDKDLKLSRLETPEFAKKNAVDLNKTWDESSKPFDDRSKSAKEQSQDWAKTNDVKNPEHLMNENVIEKRGALARPNIISSQNDQMKSVEEVRMMMGRE